jgi:hypothetical protein
MKRSGRKNQCDFSVTKSGDFAIPGSAELNKLCSVSRHTLSFSMPVISTNGFTGYAPAGGIR